ncbi:hypothetical protein ACOSQ2_018617 [Xanthoceras sorbifolium]
MAILEGVHLAAELGIRPLVVESDSKGVIELLKGSSSYRTALGLPVSRILHYQTWGNILSFSFAPRASNAAAHALSRLALSLEDRSVWRENLPRSICNVVQADMLGRC